MLCKIARQASHETLKDVYEMSWLGEMEIAVRFSGWEAGTSSIQAAKSKANFRNSRCAASDSQDLDRKSCLNHSIIVDLISSTKRGPAVCPRCAIEQDSIEALPNGPYTITNKSLLLILLTVNDLTRERSLNSAAPNPVGE